MTTNTSTSAAPAGSGSTTTPATAPPVQSAPPAAGAPGTAAPPATALGTLPDGTKPPADGTKPPVAPTEADAAKLAEAAAKLELKFDEPLKPIVEKLRPLAVKLGLDSAKAQEVVDLAAGIVKEQQAQGEKAARDLWDQRATAWKAELAAHKELGGAKLDATIATARRGVAWAGGPALAKALDASGLGDHPAVIAAFHKLGNALKDDTATELGSTTPSRDQGQEFLKAQYPSMFKE